MSDPPLTRTRYPLSPQVSGEVSVLKVPLQGHNIGSARDSNAEPLGSKSITQDQERLQIDVQRLSVMGCLV